MQLYAQTIRIEGIVTNTNLEPLSYVTVQIKKQQIGTRTDDKGHFQFSLEEGEYDLVFSLLGYQIKEQKIIVRSSNPILRIILESQTKSIQEIKITSGKKDKAEDYIKQVIAHKNDNLKKIESFSCQAYIKATETETNWRTIKKKKNSTIIDSSKQKIIADSIAKELNNMSMAEIFAQIDYQYPNKWKETRNGIKKRGNAESLFYLSITEGDFSLYQHLIKIPALSETPVLSPISYSGLIGYKFKTIKTEKRSSCTLYTIKFTPIKSANALIEGEVVIVDTSWAIIDAYYTFPEHLMAEYNRFEVSLSYELVDQKTWMLDRISLNYMSKQGKSKSDGSTLMIFDEYKIDTIFSKKHFNTELSTTTIEAYERDSTFWNTVRKEPLSSKELAFIKYKDSICDYTHTQTYLDSVDKKNNKVTWDEILFTGVEFYKRSNERRININPLASIYRFLYPGGSRIGMGVNYSITPASKKFYSIYTDLAYGGQRKDVIGFIRASHRYNPFTNGIITIGVGRNYDLIFANDSYINVLRRGNFYKKDYIDIAHNVELINGLYMINKIEFAHRQPIQISTVDTRFDQWLGNAGSDSARYNVFSPYNVFYNNITFEYTPKQLYMREPKQKVILGSKFPTFYGTWRKGIPNIAKSITNYDYVEFGIKQRIKLGLVGISEYKIMAGNFLSKRNLQTIDYKFIRRGDPYIFNAPQYNFQLLDSTFPIFKQFYEGHYLHEFYGSIINKIPYVKKLKLYEIAGGGALYAPERKLIYFEVFAGLEKPFKIFGEKFKLGFYVVSSIANKQNTPFQFKIGMQHYDIYRNRWE